MSRDLVSKQLVYWAQIAAAGTVDFQNGPALLTVALGASIYTITMPANNTVPINRRGVLTQTRAAAASVIAYNEAGSAVNTILLPTFQGAQVATNTQFIIEIGRVEFLIGAGVG